MHVDVVFVFLSPDSYVPQDMEKMGFHESCRRPYSFLGFEAIHYCFDNLRLALIKVVDEDAFHGAMPQLVGIPQRRLWKTLKTFPFGLGVSQEDLEKTDFHFVDIEDGFSDDIFGKTIPVALCSTNTRQPLLFGARHCNCIYGTDGQHVAMPDYGAVSEIHIGYPKIIAPSAEIHQLAAQGAISLSMGCDKPRMILTIKRVKEDHPLRLEFPDCFELH